MQLYDYQKKIVEHAKKFDHYAFFLDMGCGKTSIVLNTVKSFSRVVIFTPKITLRNWMNEFKLWKPELKPAVVCGTSQKRKQIIEKNNILIINYEAMRSNDVYCALIRFKPDVVICDESQKLKSHTSMQTKRIIDVSKLARNKYILSGTPITNSYEDIFSQYAFLDNGVTFGTNFFVFRNKYFFNRNANWTSNKAFPDWAVNETMKTDLIEKINTKATFLKKEQCLDLPELVETRIDSTLCKEQQVHYDNIKEELITWIEENKNNPMVVQNALTKIIRLNEICSGYMKMNDNSIHRFKQNSKLDLLKETLECIGDKTIIFCSFRQNYIDIAKMLGGNYVEIHGGVDDNHKFENIEAFNNDPGIRYAIVNPGSGGIGINLKSASYSIYYSRTFNLEHYLQSKARNYRAGSIDLHKKITHINLITTGTIDEAIYLSLLGKKDLLNSIHSIKELITRY